MTEFGAWHTHILFWEQLSHCYFTEGQFSHRMRVFSHQTLGRGARPFLQGRYFLLLGDSFFSTRQFNSTTQGQTDFLKKILFTYFYKGGEGEKEEKKH